MEKLLNLLNSLSVDGQQELAFKCETSIGYLRKACSAKQTLGPALCVSLERESSGGISRRDLRPDDWQEIWPELANSKHP